MKKKYRVWAKMTSYSYLDVEAESEDEAINIANETDGGEFIPTTSEILPDVKEVNE